MRVVVVSDAVAGLTADRSARAIAEGFHRVGQEFGRPVQLAVVPMAAGAPGVAGVLARATGGAEELVAMADGGPGAAVVMRSAELLMVGLDAPAPRPGLPPIGSSHPFGALLAAELAASNAPEVVVDLTAVDAHDGGAGLLAALGATADVDLTGGWPALAALTRIDLGPARQQLGGRRLTALVAAEELGRPLLGLRGITSLRGRPAGEVVDPAPLLAADAALQIFATRVDPALADTPGAGAAGGVALALQALGATVTTGPDHLAERFGLRDTIAAADLVVVAAGAFDFAHRGGAVVQEVSGWSGSALRPCVVLAATVQISQREMRLMGVESAHPVHPVIPGAGEPAVSEAELSDLAVRVARSWLPRG